MTITQNQKSNLIYGFLICIYMDIASKNVWLLWDNWQLSLKWELRDKIYFCMTSFAFLCYLSYFYLAATVINVIELRIIAANWAGFGIQDLFDEISGTATVFQYMEYWMLPIVIVITLCEIYKFNPFKFAGLLIKYIFTFKFKRAKELFLNSHGSNQN